MRYLESGAGLIGGALLTTNSIGGLTLNGANTVSKACATNITSGDHRLTNTAAFQPSQVLVRPAVVMSLLVTQAP